MIHQTIEYVWTDEKNNFVSKSRSFTVPLYVLKDVPPWDIDGSSLNLCNYCVTLKPLAMFNDPFYPCFNQIHKIVYCEKIINNISYESVDILKNTQGLFDIKQGYVILDRSSNKPILTNTSIFVYELGDILRYSGMDVLYNLNITSYQCELALNINSEYDIGYQLCISKYILKRYGNEKYLCILFDKPIQDNISNLFNKMSLETIKEESLEESLKQMII